MTAAGARAGVTVAIVPASSTVAPGSEFDVNIIVTEAGSSFNAFGLVIGFDSEALTPVPISPLSEQVGSAMRAACTNVFNDFRAGSASDTINCALLCGGASIPGPGQVYRLRFRAALESQAAELWFVSKRFYHAGVLIAPVTSGDAVVWIGTPPVEVGNERARPRLWVTAAPNPNRAGTMLTVDSPTARDLAITISDLQGRLVRKLFRGWVPAGTRQVWWDGRDQSGVQVRPGSYKVVTRGGGEAVIIGLSILR